MIINLKQLFCSHKKSKLVIIGGSINVEEVANKCLSCGKLFNKRLEI